MPKYMTRAVVLIVAAGLSLGLVAVLGCSGGSGGTLGSAAGWVFTTPDGDSVIISADSVPPEGWEAVLGAKVQVEGYPDLRDITNASGRYLISGIPPGGRTIIVTINGDQYRFQVNIVAGQTVSGGGHSEGGGTL